MTICANLAEINEKIAVAAAKSGRKREDITLVAVSKTVGAAEVNEAYASGQRVFAENRVQCLLEKLDTTAPPSDNISSGRDGCRRPGWHPGLPGNC